MPEFVSAVGSEALVTLAYLLAPPMLAALLVGLVVGVAQAATSVNEMTLSFVPKIVIVCAVMVMLGPRMFDRCQRLFALIFSHIQAMGS